MKRLRGPALIYLLAILSAVLLILSFPNWNLIWFAPFALTPLLIALAREPRLLHRFLLGYVTGNLYWLGICNWIQFVLEVHGGMGRWGGWGAFALFCLIKSLHMAIFALLAAIVLPHWYAIPAVAALWTGIERTHSDLGFAWLCLGNAGIGMPLPMRLAPWIGVYGLSFLFAMMSAALAGVLLRQSRKRLLWLAVIPALLLLPQLPAPEEGTESAALVQPNAPEELEWTRFQALDFHSELIRLSLQAAVPAHSNLILWPEVPGPIYYYRDPALRAGLERLAQTTRAWLLIGTVASTPAGAPLNSAVLLNPQGELVDRYDKINLVPFGEFVPPFFEFVNRVTQEAGDFAAGNRIVVFPMGAHKLGAFICYESVFPQEVREFVKGGAQLLVNISNDGYFGHSAARAQHLEIVRMRAAENARWILRATNDGITASIDPAGRVVKSLPLYEAASGAFNYNFETATTFYTRHGDWFAWGCWLPAIAALFASQWPHYRPRRVAPSLRRSDKARRP